MKAKYAFIAGIVVTCIIGGIILGIGIMRKKNQVTVSQNFLAPYYDKKAFLLPDDFKPKATASASLERIEKIPIIMYHYVEYIKDINDLVRRKLNISPALFEEQLKKLSDVNYKTYFVRDVPDILDGKIDYSTKSVMLTFDDGYEDFYYDVFPVLKRYQMKATMYIIYDFIGRKGFMNEAEIKEILASGLVELGSHTLDHLYLKLIPVHIARKQIIDSKKKLEERFGIQVKTFAYPYGAFSQETVDLVKNAGYIAAVSVIPGMQQSKSNLFYLSRVRPGVFTPNTIIKVIENYSK